MPPDAQPFSETRNDLVRYIEDQIQNGIYRTQQREVRVKDTITNAEKTQTVVEIVIAKNGLPERQEAPVLQRFGIKPFGFTIKRMPYDAQVEKQIQQQQQITMDVQTAIADSKKAEQRTLTVTEQGKANAAEAKWKQEQVKATAVVTAEQEKAVAILGCADHDRRTVGQDAARPGQRPQDERRPTTGAGCRGQAEEGQSVAAGCSVIAGGAPPPRRDGRRDKADQRCHATEQHCRRADHCRVHHAGRRALRERECPRHKKQQHGRKQDERPAEPTPQALS